jgi:hypothetical protein
VLSGEAEHTYSIVFVFTRGGLEHTIYHTRGEQSNHYTTYIKQGGLEHTIYRTRGEQTNHYTTDIKQGVISLFGKLF